MKKLKVGDTVWVKRHHKLIPVEVRDASDPRVVKVLYPGVDEVITISRARIIYM